MTEAELLAALKTTAIAETWPSTSNVVFPTGSVHVTGSIEDLFPSALKTQRVPILLIQPGETEADPQHDEDPNFVRFAVRARMAQQILGDAVGENGVLGGYKVNGVSKSEGQGIYTLEQRLWDAIGKMNALEGIVLQNRFKSATQQGMVSPTMKVIYRDYIFEAMVTVV